MTLIHAVSSTLGARAWPQGAGRSARANSGLAAAIVLFLAVLIVEAVIIVTSPPSVSDLGSLYLITT